MNENKEFKFILICAVGRSASTSLLNIINTIPNCNICGENEGAINNLLECWNNLKKTKKLIPMNNDKTKQLNFDECVKMKKKTAWYNSYDIDICKKNIQNTIINILDNKKNNKILGFKEIRYFNCLHLINTFLELFPNTKVICHYKIDIYSQKHSIHKENWWNENNIDHIKKYNSQLIEFYEKNINFCYLFTFEKLFQIEEIKKLFLFLDEPFEEKRINEMLNWDTL